jgi:RNA polymerase sigma-70 factor, ECF subfamily
VAKSDDQRLIKNLHAGRSDAYSELVSGHYKTVYRFLAHLTRDVHRAEDLTQETFATAWERIATFQGRSTLATWLHRIAYTKFIDSQRARRRDAAFRERIATSSYSSANPFESAIASDEARRLYAAMNELDEANRVLMVLHYLQGLSYREMALVLDEPSGTVKWRTSAALNCLRLLLVDEDPDHAKPKTATVGPIFGIARNAAANLARPARSE